MEQNCESCWCEEYSFWEEPCKSCRNYSNWESKSTEVTLYDESDVVNKPSHYKTFPDMEAIDIIKATLTEEEYKGYLKGNFLKYRLRAGFKDDITQDLDKSHVYRDWLFNLETDKGSGSGDAG